MSAEYFIAVAVVLFCMGIVGVVSRRSIFVLYMSLELILNSINLILATFANVSNQSAHSVLALIIIGIIAAEATLFLAMIVHLYRQKRDIDSSSYNLLAQGGSNDK